MSQLFNVDPFTGIVEKFHKENGKVIISSHADVQKQLDMNAIDRNHSDPTRGMRKVASVPPIVVSMWRNELKAEGKPNIDPFHKTNRMWLVAKLNNRDFGKLRTNEDVI